MSGEWRHHGASNGVTLLALWLAFGLLCFAVSLWLARRVWKQRKARPGATTLVTALLLASPLIGAAGMLVGGIKGFGAIGGESVDPSQQARILAEGISEAMNCSALGLLLWLPTTIAAFVLTRRKPPSG